MPKTHNRRTKKTTYRQHGRRSRFTSAQSGAVIIVILGLIVSWWLIRTNSLAYQPSGAYSVVGQPSLSADFINQVLDHYHSPATGKGQSLYNYGVKYGIDPVYALAFFMHESSFGKTGVARVTRSLGNIRVSEGYQQYDGYRKYRTWEDGFEDWYKLISDQYVRQWNLITVDEIIPVYAPSSDNNDVAAYIQAVKTAVDTWRSGTVEV
jgi:hypothetical protein